MKTQKKSCWVEAAAARTTVGSCAHVAGSQDMQPTCANKSQMFYYYFQRTFDKLNFHSCISLDDSLLATPTGPSPTNVRRRRRKLSEPAEATPELDIYAAAKLVHKVCNEHGNMETLGLKGTKRREAHSLREIELLKAANMLR